MKLPKPTAAPGSDSPSVTFNKFLKTTDIGKLGAKAKLTLTGATRLVDGQFGEQLVCEVTMGKKTFDWGVTLTSVNYRMLYERFGADVKKWKGLVKVFVKAPAAKGMRPYVAVE